MQTGTKGILFAVCAAAPIMCKAQAANAGPDTRSGTGVPIYASVRAADGKLLTGLQPGDFSVLQDKSPAIVTSVREMTPSIRPVKVVIVMDAINQDAIAFARARTEVGRFLRANGGHLAYPTRLVVSADSGVTSQARFTADGNATAAALDRIATGLRTYNQSTGTVGAGPRMSASLNLLRQLATNQETAQAHTVILWMSSGWPMLAEVDLELSRHQKEQLLNAVVEFTNLLRQQDVTLNSIDPLGGDAVDPMHANRYEAYLAGVREWVHVAYANLGLQVLAVHSGGRAIHSNNDIPGAMALCVSDAADQYRLNVNTPATTRRDVYHSLSVQVSRPGAVARSETGYYAEPANRQRLLDVRP